MTGDEADPPVEDLTATPDAAPLVIPERTCSHCGVVNVAWNSECFACGWLFRKDDRLQHAALRRTRLRVVFNIADVWIWMIAAAILFAALRSSRELAYLLAILFAPVHFYARASEWAQVGRGKPPSIITRAVLFLEAIAIHFWILIATCILGAVCYVPALLIGAFAALFIGLFSRDVAIHWRDLSVLLAILITGVLLPICYGFVMWCCWPRPPREIICRRLAVKRMQVIDRRCVQHYRLGVASGIAATVVGFLAGMMFRAF